MAKLKSEPIVDVKLESITPRGGNREIGSIDETELLGLAESMKEIGLQHPIVIRPFHYEDIDSSMEAPEHDYEIVAGERRWRAAAKIGWSTIPAVIREMTDAEAEQARVVENIQRASLNALDEAQSFKTLAENGMPIAEIAGRIGRSVKYVAGRMKLYSLAPEARKVFDEGKMTVGAAVNLARLPEPAQKKIMKAYGFGGGIRTAEEVDSWVRYNGSMQSLDKVPFDLTDSELFPKAGPCIGCPKRVGTDPTLFDDMEENLCMDSKCLRKKWNKHIDRLADGKDVEVRILGQTHYAYRTVLPTGKYEHDFERCKKADEGSMKAMWVTGDKTGKTFYVKKVASRDYTSYNEGYYERVRRERRIAEIAQTLVTRRFIDELFPPGLDAPPAIAAIALYDMQDSGIFWAELRESLPPETDTSDMEPLAIIDAAGPAAVRRAALIQDIYSAFATCRDGSLSQALLDRACSPSFDASAEIAAEQEEAARRYDREEELRPMHRAVQSSYSFEETEQWVCRVCGCTTHTPCFDKVGYDPCFWVEPNLCSSCFGKEQPVE